MTTKTSKTAKVEQDRPFRHSREWDPLSGRLPFDLSIAVFACSVVSSPLPIIWGLKAGPYVRPLFNCSRLAGLPCLQRVFSISIQGCPLDLTHSFLHSSLQQQPQFNHFFCIIID
ncbi:hypothetical protein NXS19_006269 [Fusarium pseudograminearum]|nr:hypothetical protein NXS19_006269 [Fusarium pseudograminearum]